jgi:crotonobetainyl-CoA:carnitine CoA-transferase CaiB-like acyl-CoA transferase
MKSEALKGIRVLDFTWLLAGPYATRMLADFGAEVIKVQSKKVATGTEDNLSGYFNTWNRNKLGITLDMSHSEAHTLAFRLAGICDVVVQNFAPRVMSNWGLTYEKLKEARPDIIVVNLSGMGQTGPWQNYVALAQTIHALSGLTCLTSYDEALPVGAGFAYSDIIAGLFAAQTILGALEFRANTGQGQYIEVSEYEAMCALMGTSILDYSINGNRTVPEGNNQAGEQAAPYGCYRCQGVDRWCVIAVYTDEEWKALCEVMGNPAWTTEDDFSTLHNRIRNTAALNRLIEQWTILHPPEKIMRTLQEKNVPAGIVQNAEDLAHDPQLEARNFFIETVHPVLGTRTGDGTPVKLSGSIPSYERAAPSLGQDNEYVYRELLGIGEREYSDYLNRGVIG